MFTDNRNIYDFIQLNQNIIVTEDNSPKRVSLLYLNNGFYQKTFDNITVTLVRYLGNFDSKNIIEYNDNYFSNIFNSALKVMKFI